MNLIEIREKFRNLSGRYDLVNADLSDNGADFLINNAIKWLDRKVSTTKSWGSYMTVRPVDSWYVRFPMARAVKEVWVATSEGRWQLTKKRLQDILAAYFADTPAEIISGNPLYYSPTISRYIPENLTPGALATFANYIGVMTDTNLEYNAIVFSVPVELETLVEIKGLFYSAELTEDEDENFWSVNHPMLLVQASIRQSHIATGNTPMAKIISEDIGDDLVGVEKDFVEQMVAEADEMDA